MNTEQPWQLEVFSKTLKKRLKVRYLKRYLGNLNGTSCFMVTCGDNNGAMNYQLRSCGGAWTWAEFDESASQEIESFLDEPVVTVNLESGTLPFDNEAFDRVVVVDCHEHLEDPVAFTKEVSRITKPGGKVVVSVPNGDERMLGVKIKHAIGMVPEKYGHLITGYDIPDLARLLQAAGIKPVASSYYSRFFTEMLELAINYAYVMVLSKRGAATVEEGTIAPRSADQLKSVGRAYRLYRRAYPVVRLIAGLDRLLFFARGYAVVMAGVRE